MKSTSNNGSLPSLVETLLAACRPAAIFQGITFVVVDAVQRQILRSVAHVREEILELMPALRSVDSASPIIIEARMFRIPAALNHGSPDLIFRSLLPPRVAMPYVSCPHAEKFEATAALRAMRPE
jgi:hypothetical protein